MIFHYAGKYNGDENSLPYKEHNPNAIPFKEPKDMKKYSLMESKQYQNIPRTIQNVLLNSKLDAEFIKKVFEAIHEESVRQQMEIINK